MNPNMSVCSLSLLLLIWVIGATPVSDLQNLKTLLEEELITARYDSSEELQVEEGGRNIDKSVFGALEQLTWDSSDASNLALDAKEDALTSLSKDLVRTSKRSWSRYKKGGLKSCFGVRLERIGSFSGLGC